MIIRIFIIFSTIVLLVKIAIAAPSNSPADDEGKTVKKIEKNKSTLTESLDISIPQFIQTDQQEDKIHYLSSSNSFSPRISILVGNHTKQHTDYTIGFQYMDIYKNLSIEYSVDIISSGNGIIGLSNKNYYYWSKNYRVHSRFGPSLKLISNEGMATTLSIKNYFIMSSLGIERLYISPLSLRADLEVYLGTKEHIALLSFGYSWAW